MIIFMDLELLIAFVIIFGVPEISAERFWSAFIIACVGYFVGMFITHLYVRKLES